MKAKLIKPRRSAKDYTRWVPAGTVIDHADAWKLVRLGVAVPEDEECDKRANMSQQQMEAAQYAQQKVELGIHPDDYRAYDSGLMRGYNPDGSWIPGPNAIDEFEDEDE